ncbi:hypothetical protein POTOM_027405 [Populus tomentosa]|uniref:Magnesium transporter n=1 Tax=Populus tomentosa TaxID=118781 RepID=A0A8X8CX44_POPTO|nr:hypothetical protein POTOM_027405 [Populus tomentosa]
MATKLKKGMPVVKAWLVISESGQSSIEEIGKHSMMRRTGLPARDLRALDPVLSYPSSILGRERAIVVSLEHIRAIITSKEVLLINYNNPLVVQFVQDLQHRIVFGNNNVTSPHQRLVKLSASMVLFSFTTDIDLDCYGDSKKMEPVLFTQITSSVLGNTKQPSKLTGLIVICLKAMDHTGKEMEDAAEVTWGSPSLNTHHSSEKSLSKRRAPTCNFVNMKSQEIEGEGANSTINVSVAAGSKALPFEFKALEACLESACRCLESETRTLEEEAYPALDELTSKISTLNLERVRQIKSRLVALSGRVQKVRDELENLLDDDTDMAEMYLTEKVAARAVDQISTIEEVYDGEREVDDESVDDCSETNTSVRQDIEELEMLLEAYFAQIDGILQKLSGVRACTWCTYFSCYLVILNYLLLHGKSALLEKTEKLLRKLSYIEFISFFHAFQMSEYVDDTEDFINIMLDDKQNQLLQMGVILSAANMILNAGIAVVGFFGMNIHVTLFDGNPTQFWETVIGTCGGCIALFLALLGWGKRKKILAL